MKRFFADLGNEVDLKLKSMGGCHIVRGRKVHELKLDQHLYVKSMVETFGVEKESRISALTGLPTLF